MSTQKFHLAQINIALMKAPLDDPLMAEFVANLDGMNALADRSPGFVWRLEGEGGDATDVRPYAENILVNVSVWETPEDLFRYTFRSQHTEILKKRRQWLAPYDGAYSALWWIPAGHIPTVDEAKERLDYLRERGETVFAFTYKQLFPPPEGSAV
jgi:hypothetical protein